MRAAALLGAAGAFLLLGALGLAAVFRSSIQLDLVHLAVGAVGLAAAARGADARRFLRGGGIVSLLLWFLGAAAIGDRLPVRYADNWVHFVLGVGLLALGAVTPRAAALSPSSA